MKKYLAELVGTFVLTLFGCGTAVSLNCGVDTASVVGTALAFGIAVVAMAYAIGGISGCHINPAITIGCLLSGRISGKDAAGYIVAQVIGAIVASSVLYLMVSTAEVAPAGTATGANACNLGIANGFMWKWCLLLCLCSWCWVLPTARRAQATSPDWLSA